MLSTVVSIATLALPLLSFSNASLVQANGSRTARTSGLRTRSYVRPKPNLARWAEYGKPASNFRRGRREYHNDGNELVARAGYSPLPILTGETITQTVAKQIQNDVESVLQQFKNVPAEVQNVVKTAINQILNQQISNKDPEQQYNIISTSILNQLNAIEDNLDDTLNLMTAPMDDTQDFETLRQCILTIVALGGLKTADDADKGTCLTESGFSLAHLTDQFNTFVDLNSFHAPANAVNAATKEITDYLNSVELVPALEYLIGNATQSLQNVVLTVAANQVSATQKSFECWIEALQVISTVPLLDRTRLCDSGNGQSVDGTALHDLEQAFIAKSNQFMGVLPPDLAINIQKIGLTTLSLTTGSYESNTRDLINTAILSATSTVSGESASVVHDLIKCLNTIYDADSSNDCNPNSNDEILMHNENVYYNYLSQFVSTLPKKLVENLNATVQAQLEGDSGPDAESLRQQLQALFDQASLGSDYEGCEREFQQCVVAALTEGTVTTSCTDQKGPACQSLPAMAPGQIDTGSQLGDIAAGLTGDGQWFGITKQAKRFNRAVSKLARNHAAFARKHQNPVARSNIELMSEHGL